jgi:hypothetical protein
MADDYTSTIASLRARGIASDDLDDADLGAIIALTLKEYSRYRPLIATGTFTTVADQQAYAITDINADAITALTVIWNPEASGDVWDVGRVLLQLGLPADIADWDLPSQDILANIKAASYQSAFGGSGRQLDRDGGAIYLSPLPDASGTTVFVVYTKRHTSIATIKSLDEDIWLDLLEGYCAERLVNEIAKKSTAVSVKTPEYERSVGESIGYWRKRGKELRDRFLSKCNAGKAAGARS